MKFYEIVTGKLVSSDVVDSFLQLKTYVRLSDCALQLGLNDRLISFSSQGLDLQVNHADKDSLTA